jgi:UDP-N-acetylglucosamine:LPS N-acetylglucosamine transferase
LELKQKKFRSEIKRLPNSDSGNPMKRNKKIGLICSHGGHFTEILQLLEAFEGYPTFLLTYKEKATSDQRNTYYISNIGRGPIALVVGIIKIFSILLKERPDILFSTGSEIAIPSFYFGKFLFRTKLIYLECSAQVYQPSMTGRCIYPITDLFLVQWEPLLKRYGPKAKYVGGLI